MKPALSLSVLREIIARHSSPLAPLPAHRQPSTRKLEGIRHLAFDIYGTLLVSGVGDIGNSAPTDRGSALRNTLAAFDVPVRNDDSLETLFLSAIRNNQAKATALGSRQPEVEIREVWREILAEVDPSRERSDETVEEIALRFELSVNPVWPMPGLVTTLEELSQRFPPFAIVSNAQFFTPEIFPSLTGKTLRELHFDPDACVWSFAEREAKPSPRLFERLLERLGANATPDEVLYIGNDFLNDVAAAAEAGLRTALFAGDRRSLRLREDHPRCKGIAPDLVITALDQLPARV